MEIMYTVNPGIEDVAADEVLHELGGRVEYELLSGHVYHVVDSVDYEAVYRLRSINKAFILIWSTAVGEKLDSLISVGKELYSLLKERGIWYYVNPYTSFAVETERVGRHEFTSIDVSRIVGEMVIKVVEEKTGKRPLVNLRNPDVLIHVFVRDNKLYMGLSLTGRRSLHRRGYRIYDHPAALKPTLAYAMLAITSTRDGDLIVDPMCGGGTIAIEAALMHEDKQIYCLDVNPVYVKMAERNAFAAGVASSIVFSQWDARRIDEYGFKDWVDHIVSNPPYGIRYGDPRAIRELYTRFLSSAYRVLETGGRATLITTEYSYLSRIASRLGYVKVHERVVQHGGLYPHIVVLEKSKT